MLTPELSTQLAPLGLSPDLLPRFERLLGLVKDTHQRINLVSFSSLQELEFFHLLDSLMALKDDKVRSLTPARVVDVGTGGGFPGLPLALARPDWSITLLDSIQKKLRELESMAETLGLSVHTLWGRAEEKARDPHLRESFDLALCRAVGSLSCVLELTLPFVKVGGCCLLHRGADAPAELEKISPALKKLGGTAGPLIPYGWPGLEKQRFILRIDKSHQTPSEYPRRVGIPERRPL
jgi:16S rRNA (guanine527-N7)-methyltransferase